MMTEKSQLNHKIIFFAPILEYPATGGPQISVINAIKALNKVTELHILTNVNKKNIGSISSLNFISENCHNLLFLPTSKVYFSNKKLLRVTRVARRIFAPFFAFFDVRVIRKYAKEKGIRIIWIDRVIEHSYSHFMRLKRGNGEFIVIGDTEAVYSRFILRELPFEKNILRKIMIYARGQITINQEKKMVKLANVVTAVSKTDMDFFSAISPSQDKVRMFSNTIDVNAYIKKGNESHTLKNNSVLLLGSYGHKNSPMDRAAKWLVEEVMPLVWEVVSDVHLYIVGRNADVTQSKYRCEKITVIGKTPSIIPFLHNAVATLVPLQFESGTRFKILESGAATIPCISTTLGAEGIKINDGIDIIIADTPKEFSSAIIKLVTNTEMRSTIGKNLNGLIRKNYSLEKQIEESRAIIRYLTEKSNDT